MVRILVVDCQDSFVYNLVELLRKNPLCVYQILPLASCVSVDLSQFDALLLSPGPGVPREREGLFDLLEACYKTHSILGVCLGHQAIASFFGARLKQSKQALHGYGDYLQKCDFDDPLLEGFSWDSPVARYHSWEVERESLTKDLQVLAFSKTDGAIMALRHKLYPLWGVQFHPESFLSEEGACWVNNWIKWLFAYKNK